MVFKNFAKPKKYKMEMIAAAAVLSILCCLLLVRPIIGVADNGDFARIMNSTGLHFLTDEPAERYFGFVNRQYGTGYVIPLGGGYLSTQIPLVLLAIYLSKSVLEKSLFDIRFLAMIYILVLTVSAFFTVRSIRKKHNFLGLIAAFVIILIFCDTGYSSYFNSLYGEPVTLVFLLLMTAMAITIALEEKPAVWMLALFCTGALFFAGGKVQNSPAGLLAALVCTRLAGFKSDFPGKEKRKRLMAEVPGKTPAPEINGAEASKVFEIVPVAETGEISANGVIVPMSEVSADGLKGKAWKRISIGAALLVSMVSLGCYFSVSREIKVCNKYQTVFYGILKDSPDPAGDLGELGLDPSLAVLAGTNYFIKQYPIDIKDPVFKEMLYEKVSHFKVTGFYLKHPQRFLQKLESAAEHGFQLKQGFGNYEKFDGIQYKQTSNVFGLWSDFKMDVLPHTLSFVVIFFTIVMLVLLYEYKRASGLKIRFFIEFLGFITLTGIIQFVLPVIGDGDADLSKHLYLFNVCFDLLFAAGIVYITQKAAEAVKSIRNRRPETRLQTD